MYEACVPNITLYSPFLSHKVRCIYPYIHSANNYCARLDTTDQVTKDTGHKEINGPYSKRLVGGD